MKKLFCFSILFICYTHSFAQSVVAEQNGRVTMRNQNDSVLAQIEPPGSGAAAASIDSTNSEVAIIYNTGRVLVKTTGGNEITEIAGEDWADKAVSITWQGADIIITTASGQTLVKKSAEWREE